MEADVIEGRVVQAALVLLHLGLDPTDAPLGALGAPVAVLAPVQALALQGGVAAAAEADVVGSGVVPDDAVVGLHAQLEGGQVARGAVLGCGPVTVAVRQMEHNM